MKKMNLGRKTWSCGSASFGIANGCANGTQSKQPAVTNTTGVKCHGSAYLNQDGKLF